MRGRAGGIRLGQRIGLGLAAVHPERWRALSPIVQQSHGPMLIATVACWHSSGRLIGKRAPWKIAVCNPINSGWKLAVCFHEFLDRLPGGSIRDEQPNRQQRTLLAANPFAQARQISLG